MLIVIYILLSFALGLYGFHRTMLLYLYVTRRRTPEYPQWRGDLPRVTVQLPIYNERYVLERLLEAVLALDYPRELLQIQVLDDSTDETRQIAATLVAAARTEGHDITLLQREHRDGFKAGALREALPRVAGTFIAIFDADFVPEPDFLRRVLPHFSDEQVGMVQARWSHLNRDYSLLTRIQAIMLDGHFILEHTSRYWGGRLIHFNGTAGMWRKSCIEDAGGWSADTLTEDLDLSYRAQLAGWRFTYLPHVTVPAELPVDIYGFKSQQHRWAKGTLQTAKKLLPRILRSRLTFAQKLEAFFHLTNHFAYAFTLCIVLLSYPGIVLAAFGEPLFIILVEIPVFLMATCSVFTYYAFSQRELGRRPEEYLTTLPLVLATGVGMAFHATVALAEGLLGQGGEFVRTPKHGELRSGESWRTRLYRGRQTFLPFMEAGIAGYLVFCMGFAWWKGFYLSIPFLGLFAVGFLFLVGLSIQHGTAA